MPCPPVVGLYFCGHGMPCPYHVLESPKIGRVYVNKDYGIKSLFPKGLYFTIAVR